MTITINQMLHSSHIFTQSPATHQLFRRRTDCNVRVGNDDQQSALAASLTDTHAAFQLSAARAPGASAPFARGGQLESKRVVLFTNGAH